MLPAARIQAVIELLATVIATQKPADATVSAYFRERRFIGSKDRAAISTRIFRIMRTWHRLSWWIKRCNCDVNARTLTIADLMFEREHNMDSIGSIFDGDRYSPHPLKENELQLVKAMDKKNLEHPEMPERERLECPEWAYEMMKESLGSRFETEMKAMLTPAPLDLRVNLIKGHRADVLKELRKDDINAEAGKHSPLAIRVAGRPPISQHPLYNEGVIEIQDEGSQMVALVADAKPGEQVVDFCAGAGGKTLALGAAMNNKGRIVAMDVLDMRLDKAKLRFRRAGLHNIETRALSNERDKWVKRHQNHFDLVLVDAPCTGTGTWRRDPDKRWRMLGPGLSSLAPLQRDILESACRLVKVGGRLVYATCSLLNEENDNQIDTFLKTHPEFEKKRRFFKNDTRPARH